MPATATTGPASSEDLARLTEPLLLAAFGLLAVLGLPPVFPGRRAAAP